MPDNKPLLVTSPLLPSLQDLSVCLSDIWKSKWVTNHGQYHNRLEETLGSYLKTDNCFVFNNGTIALLVALKLFDFKLNSEVITTPFTFAATAHSIAWNQLTPVFVDVKQDGTICPKSIEKAITDKTCAILGVHVYGTPCDVEAINKIAVKYDLVTIYDAAHAFGTEIDGVGIGCFGDITMFSFHATKLFNTIEGGCLTTPHTDLHKKIYLLRNFGISDEASVLEIGINGKMNEIQAAVGLLNLDLVAEEKKKRHTLREKYNHIFSAIKGVSVQQLPENVTYSEQYYPVFIDKEKAGFSRDQMYDQLKQKNIYTRKYFTPICTDFVPFKDYQIVTNHSNAVIDSLKSQVLCLPFHSDVTDVHLHIIRDSVTNMTYLLANK